jgi:hypothetical protein
MVIKALTPLLDPLFGQVRFGVRFVWGENGSKRNASVGALLFFPT